MRLICSLIVFFCTCLLSAQFKKSVEASDITTPVVIEAVPDSIFNFLSERDNIGMSDYFGVYFDPYNQGQVAYGFFVTPAGVHTELREGVMNEKGLFFDCTSVPASTGDNILF